VCPLDRANDADGDGLCADVDACPTEVENDADGDGLCAATDNCPVIANSDQADRDADGIGDACDPFPLDPANDIDGDGIGSNGDNCPVIANPDQSDRDADGIGDACDDASTEQLLEDLARRIEKYAATNGLKRGQANSLLAKLGAAGASLQAGRVSTALNQLDAFSQEVAALVRAGILPAATGEAWLNAAREIDTAIGLASTT
jgi:hypothetical protein